MFGHSTQISARRRALISTDAIERHTAASRRAAIDAGEMTIHEAMSQAARAGEAGMETHPDYIRRPND